MIEGYVGMHRGIWGYMVERRAVEGWLRVEGFGGSGV